ncbi:MAG TPA: response regulator [Steroidobacter sp.]
MSAARNLRLLDSTRQVLSLTIAVVVVLAAMAALALLVVWRELEAARIEQGEAQNTRTVLEQVEHVRALLQDAQIGERGYVITGREEFLEPYYAAEQSIEQEVSRLEALVRDPGSVEMADELHERARDYMKFVAEVISLRRSQGSDAAGELIRTGAGSPQMERIRELMAALETHENAVLDQRWDAFSRRSARSEKIAIAVLSFAVLLTLGTGFLLVRHTRGRLNAEEAARDAATLLQATLDNISQGIAVYNQRSELLVWNARYVQLRGLDPASVRVGLPLEEIVSSGMELTPLTESGPLDVPARKSAISGRVAVDGEVRRDDGSILQVRGRPMADGSYVVTYTDVTALKLSESAYRDQATRLSSILDNVVDAIVTINESGSIESWSKGAERLFGYTTGEVLRRNVRMLMPEPHASAHDGYLKRYLETGERRLIGRRRELEARHKDGRIIPVDLAISEMQIGSRRLFIGIVRDMTARHEVERLKTDFVSTVSHELRTPLTSIAGSLGLLAGAAAGELPDKAARLIEIARLNCERLVRLINDILDLERAESGRLDLRLEPQRLKPLVQHAIDLNRAYAHNFGVSIELAEGADPEVLVDRDRLVQVITNILSNAAKFSPQGGVVHVSIEVVGDQARVSVKDQGPGIAPEFRPRLFQRFAQADSSDSRAKGGTGLGLSIAKSMIERLGGTIGFESTVGRGSTFYITLPVREMGLHRALPRAPLDGMPSVLVCEDDPDVAHILVDILSRERLHAEAVTSASAARAALARTRFDVALIDLHLPDTDGLDLIRELRSREATRALPIIVMTARPRSADDMEHVSALQLADWLQKPLDRERLLIAIRNALAGVRDRRPCILHVEDDTSLTQLVEELLKPEADVIAAYSLAQARELLVRRGYDLVILDIALGDGSGLELLPQLHERGGLAPPVILYSATEASREVSGLVQAALVKSRDSIEQLLATVRVLAGKTEQVA